MANKFHLSLPHAALCLLLQLCAVVVLSLVLKLFVCLSISCRLNRIIIMAGWSSVHSAHLNGRPLGRSVAQCLGGLLGRRILHERLLTASLAAFFLLLLRFAFAARLCHTDFVAHTSSLSTNPSFQRWNLIFYRNDWAKQNDIIAKGWEAGRSALCMGKCRVKSQWQVLLNLCC